MIKHKQSNQIKTANPLKHLKGSYEPHKLAVYTEFEDHYRNYMANTNNQHHTIRNQHK